MNNELPSVTVRKKLTGPGSDLYDLPVFSDLQLIARLFVDEGTAVQTRPQVRIYEASREITAGRCLLSVQASSATSAPLQERESFLPIRERDSTTRFHAPFWGNVDDGLRKPS